MDALVRPFLIGNGSDEGVQATIFNKLISAGARKRMGRRAERRASETLTLRKEVR